MTPVKPSPETQAAIDAILATFDELLSTGKLPSVVPEIVATHENFLALIRQLSVIQEFSLALARGDLSYDTKIKGRVGGALKSLQSNLRHLTWQAQRIAEGDLSQRVDFMGEFATAFNTMVDHIRQSQEALEQHAEALTHQRQAAYNLMLEAQASQAETEATYRQLQEKMEEIQSLQAQLREQATKDALTGLYNRHYLEETLVRELSRAGRESTSLSLIMLDIDHFKKLNDTYGHPTGDVVLQSLGNLILRHIRVSDFPYRYGGEEFLIILPNASIEAAQARANEIRLAFASMTHFNHGQSVQATFSAGVAAYPQHGSNPKLLIQAADEALYTSKATGRDRVTLAAVVS